MALGSTQPLKEMSTRNLPGGGGGVRGGRRVKLTILLPSVRRLPRKCGSLDISQTYGPPHPVTRIALLLPLPYMKTYGGRTPHILNFRIQSSQFHAAAVLSLRYPLTVRMGGSQCRSAAVMTRIPVLDRNQASVIQTVA
jgi:hypothetical protein